MNDFQFKVYVTVSVPMDPDLHGDDVIEKATSDFEEAIYDFAEENGWIIDDLELK